MPKHDVTFTIPERSLGKSDLEFAVKKDSEVLGRFRVSKGGLLWIPKKQKKGLTLTWAQLGKLMEENGKPRQ